MAYSPFEVYKQRNGLSDNSEFLELIERVFNDGLAMGFDLSNKLKLISEHTDQKVVDYSPEVWDECGDFYVDALLKRGRKLDQEFFQKVDEAIDKLPVSDIIDE
jgi:hypothetical protein